MSDRFPEEWIDRKKVIRDQANPTLEAIYRNWSDPWVMAALDRLNVLAVDPGGTTGVSHMQVKYTDLVDPHKPVHTIVGLWQTCQIDCGAMSGNAADTATAYDNGGLGISETGEAAGIALIYNVAEQLARFPLCVVIEDFVPQEFNKSRDFLSPVRLSARLEQLLWELQACTVLKQTAGQAKSKATDDRLERWGFMEGGHADRHKRDADRHALLLLSRIRQRTSMLHKAFPIVAEAKRRKLL